MSEANTEYRNGANGTSNGVNGTSNGVKHATNGAVKTSSRPDLPIFRALDGCNIGFQNWHPVPVTPNGDKLAGQGDLGGVWEWTSTPLTAHEDFKAMEIYPGYTCKCAMWYHVCGLFSRILQRTFSTASIISFKAVRGQRCPGLRDGLHCELLHSDLLLEGDLLIS
jgi:hypothetical protein